MHTLKSNLVDIKSKKNQTETIKKYIFVIEDLNYGLSEKDEKHLVRYDLKGSTLNRFVYYKELLQNKELADHITSENLKQRASLIEQNIQSV